MSLCRNKSLFSACGMTLQQTKSLQAPGAQGFLQHMDQALKSMLQDLYTNLWVQDVPRVKLGAGQTAVFV